MRGVTKIIAVLIISAVFLIFAASTSNVEAKRYRIVKDTSTYCIAIYPNPCTPEEREEGIVVDNTRYCIAIYPNPCSPDNRADRIVSRPGAWIFGR